MACVIACGVCTIAFQILTCAPEDTSKFVGHLLITILASGLHLSVPSAAGTLSVNLLFILIAIFEFRLAEAVVIGSASALVQAGMQGRAFFSLLFRVSTTALAIIASHEVYVSPIYGEHAAGLFVKLLFSGAALFLVQTTFIATAIVLSESRAYRKVWRDGFFWTFSYYIVGAFIAGLYCVVAGLLRWQVAMLVLPVIYLIYRSYVLYLARLEDERKHTEEMSKLHLRTIEALAMAIEAKDNTTHDHLQRVQIYALEIGNELALPPAQIEALRAAALLHDIGKLAVPEHIISKPGKLTPEEFEKMKIHPVVGAEILERVKFPYPVVPMVRHHHEKWNGAGYPDGLKGEAIPIGARILAAVDCLDALASDRQYRKALPLDEAMGVVQKESGTSFDPRIVEILARRYKELEAMAHERGAEIHKLTTDVKIERGEAPAAGFEGSAAFKGTAKQANSAKEPGHFLSSIAAARQEAQAIYELSTELGNSLSLDETLSLMAVRLKKLVPFDTLAVFAKRDNQLAAEFVTGENARVFEALQIPVGEGLCGWVAENRKPIVNGNPAVEPGYLEEPGKSVNLRSAMAVPLEGVDGVVGVLVLYERQKDAFSRDHLRMLQAISSKVGLSIQNALRFRQAEDSATTDYLTGLPNARSLYFHLDAEIARAKRGKTSLTVFVCDLDGFKSINDRFGHLEGNKVLKVVGQGFRDSCRKYDYVARMGGDEFVLVFPGLKPEDMNMKREALSDVARRAGIDVVNQDVLDVSAGWAHLPEDGDEVEQLLAEADKRMYKVKQEQKAKRNAGGAPSVTFSTGKPPSSLPLTTEIAPPLAGAPVPARSGPPRPFISIPKPAALAAEPAAERPPVPRAPEVRPVEPRSPEPRPVPPRTPVPSPASKPFQEIRVRLNNGGR